MLYGTDAENLRTLAVRVLSQTASASGCERNWSTFSLIHSKQRNRLGHENLQKLIFVHYNMRLMMKHLQQGSNKDDSADPIDLTDIFSENEEDDPLYSWVREIGEPTLDEAGGRPNAHIAEQMGANVDSFMATEGQNSPRNPFSSEDDDNIAPRPGWQGGGYGDVGGESSDGDDSGDGNGGGGGGGGMIGTGGGAGGAGGSGGVGPPYPHQSVPREQQRGQEGHQTYTRRDRGNRDRGGQRDVPQDQYGSTYAPYSYTSDFLSDSLSNMSIGGGSMGYDAYGSGYGSAEYGGGGYSGGGYGSESSATGYGYGVDGYAAYSNPTAQPVPTQYGHESHDAYPRIGVFVNIDDYAFQGYIHE